ncbi:diiron oxygenase [Rhodococcus sp. BGS-1C]|uniref:AurF N-oxygenase family protein n=1 Tax=Nocardiaceae TaxID=85025 RepID=UPI0019D2D6B3|nr:MULTISPECIES: diiron oxygenase [Rhodococcus]MCZ4274953.1 diiron oxygenase [Rhodococcus yunnanensis]
MNPVEAARPALTTQDAVTVRARTVGPRDKTARRLLKSTADKFYDAEVDIDWDAPVVEGKKWLPDHRISLYGTSLWNKLDEEQRRELGRHEIVSILSFGIYAEGFLSTSLLRVFGMGSLSDHSLYSIAEVGEESRHSIMFGKLIEKAGIEPYLLPKFSLTLVKLGQFLPIGPATYGATLLIEEVLDRAQREIQNDPEMQPHLRQLMRIHVVEESRHITYAREELVRGMRSMNRFNRALHRVILAAIANVAYPSLVNPRVYRAVGINPIRGSLTAMFSTTYKNNVQFMSEPMVRFFADAGMCEGFVTRRLWRMTRAMPDDLL